MSTGRDFTRMDSVNTHGAQAWLLFQPEIVASRAVLLGHHLVSISLILHPLTHPPHLRYVAWMAVVEV